MTVTLGRPNMHQPNPVDFATLLVALGALIFGEPLAALIGPYAVIVLGSLAGAALNLTRREAFATRLQALSYVTTLVVFALLMTVPMSLWLESHIAVKASWTLGPVAILVAGIGHEWPEVLRWAAQKAQTYLNFPPKR